jgi:hypothetical protein
MLIGVGLHEACYILRKTLHYGGFLLLTVPSYPNAQGVIWQCFQLIAKVLLKTGQNQEARENSTKGRITSADEIISRDAEIGPNDNFQGNLGRATL